MTKLSDAQLILLSRAAERDDGAAIAPAKMNRGAATKVGASLAAKKLMREVHAKADMPVWREDEAGRRYSLVLTRAGRDAIGVEDDAIPSTRPSPAPQKAIPAAMTQKTSVAVQPEPRSIDGAPRPGSKQALVVEMLRKEDGATIDALVAATGWLPHTTRAALTGLRKRGFELVRTPRETGGSIYRIVSAASASASGAVRG